MPERQLSRDELGALITKAPAYPFVPERPLTDPEPIPDRYRAAEIAADFTDAEEARAALTIWEKFTLAIDNTVTGAKLVALLTPYFLQFTAGYVMGNWKTTISAVLGAIAMLLSHIGIIIPESWETLIGAVALAVVGILAKDGKSKEPTQP